MREWVSMREYAAGREGVIYYYDYYYYYYIIILLSYKNN